MHRQRGAEIVSAPHSCVIRRANERLSSRNRDRTRAKEIAQPAYLSLSPCLPVSLPASLPHCLPASLPPCLPASLSPCLPASLSPSHCLTVPLSLPHSLTAFRSACLRDQAIGAARKSIKKHDANCTVFFENNSPQRLSEFLVYWLWPSGLFTCPRIASLRVSELSLLPRPLLRLVELSLLFDPRLDELSLRLEPRLDEFSLLFDPRFDEPVDPLRPSGLFTCPRIASLRVSELSLRPL